MMVAECGFEVLKVLHGTSAGLYRVSYRRAKETGRLAEGLPDPSDEQALDRWLEKKCAAPHGELMLLFARKKE